jgi:hypothetical protein
MSQYQWIWFQKNLIKLNANLENKETVLYQTS